MEERYFYVTARVIFEGGHGTMSAVFEVQNGFLNQRKIIEYFKEKATGKTNVSVLITNIIEMTKSDFEDFVEE